MCDFLYGALNGQVDEAEYKKTHAGHEFKFSIGTRHNVKMAMVNENYEYRMSNWMCDCDTPLGRGNKDDEYIKDCAELIRELSGLEGANEIYFCKTGNNDRQKSEETLRLSEINLEELLANLKNKRLYTLKLKQ